MTLSRESSAVLRGAGLDKLPVATLVGHRPVSRIDEQRGPLSVEVVDEGDAGDNGSGSTTDQLVSEAYEAGFSEGAGAAEIALRDALAAVLDGLDRSVGQLDAARRAWGEMGPDDAISLAIDLAEMILMREVASSGTAGRDALRRCFAELEVGERATIRLNPDDLESLGLVDDLRAERSFELVGDPTIDSGDAVADLGGGSVDARIRSALDRVRQELQP